MIKSQAVTQANDLVEAQPVPKKPAFGSVFTSNMLSATYENGAWSEFTIRPLENFSLHPATLVLHYSQTIFEGMKAYRQADGTIALFRPDMNAARLNRSATRMAIPAIDEAAFIRALGHYVACESAEVPVRPGSLYLRPTIFASEAAIGVRPANKFEFFVIAMPVESYFSGDTNDAVEIFVSESVVRAAPGGTGDVKAGANYAITLKVIEDAKKLGSDQVLFLDANDRLVEEAGGMNFMAVRNNQLITPPLSGTILGGVIRDSILQIAPDLGLQFREQSIQIDELIAEIKSGVVTELLLCGTAAIVASIGTLRFESGEKVSVAGKNETPVTNALRDALLAIQFGTAADPKQWMVPAR